MHQVRKQVRSITNVRTLYIRAPQTPRDIQLNKQLALLDGDGNLLGLSEEELFALAQRGSVYQAEFLRPSGRTRNLICASTAIVDRWVDGCLFAAVSNCVVKSEHRNSGIAALNAAAPIASRVLLDARVSLALTAVTAPRAVESQRALSRIGAVEISEDEAQSLHPLLGEFHRTRQQTFRARNFEGDGPRIWIFTREAILAQMAIAYEASSENGVEVTIDGKPTRVQFEGELTEFGARQAMRAIVSGEADLPFEVVDI